MASSNISGSESPQTVAGLDAWLFRHRGRLLAPLVLILPACTFAELESEAVNWAAGLGLLAAFFVLRVSARRFIGRSSDTRRAQAHRLVTGGPYAWMRNPLYLANVMLIAGASILCELWWIAPISCFAAWWQYDRIARWEERLLLAAHPAAVAYIASVPRWVPRRPAVTASTSPPCWSWRESFGREEKRLWALAAIITVALAKEWVNG